MLVDLFSPDDAACAASRRYVDLAPDAAATLHVSASGTDANCSQTWGTRFDPSTTVDPTLAPTPHASVRTTSFISKVGGGTSIRLPLPQNAPALTGRVVRLSKVPPGSPLYADAQAGALNFTLVLGAALGARVIKWNGVWSGPSGMTLRPPSPLRWNGVYDGRGGDVGGETMPPSDCDNFWLYVDAAPRAEPAMPASGLVAIGGTNGGWSGDFFVPTVEVLAGDTWIPLDAELPTPRGGLTAAAYKGDVYALGGFTDGGETLALVEALNGTARWSPASPMLTARRYFCTVVFRCPDVVGRTEECLYAIGGGPDDLAAPEYDARALRRRPPSLFDSSRATFALIRFLRSVEVFDGGRWREDAPLTTPRMQHGAAVHGDRIYVAGGFSSFGGDALTSVESFDGTRWSALPTACVMPAAPRRGQVALASFGGRLLFAGAIDEATAVVDALTLDDAGLSCAWTRAPSLRVPRMNARLAVSDDRLFAVGGSNPPGNDTWLDETEALCPEPHAGASWQWEPGPSLEVGRTIEALAVNPAVASVRRGAPSTTTTRLVACVLGTIAIACVGGALGRYRRRHQGSDPGFNVLRDDGGAHAAGSAFELAASAECGDQEDVAVEI